MIRSCCISRTADIWRIASVPSSASPVCVCASCRGDEIRRRKTDMRIAVIGAGSWGMALAQTLSRGGESEVTLWARRPEGAATITETRHNPTYLTEIALNDEVRVTSDLRTALDGAGIVLLAIPTHGMR